MSKDNITDYGKSSIRSKLLNIAKKEDVFYQTILTRYFQERLLYRMSQTKYRSNFYLKGGALMYAYEKFAARPTLDIDVLGNNITNEGTTIVATFKETRNQAPVPMGLEAKHCCSVSFPLNNINV
jgi:hypothetical protein